MSCRFTPTAVAAAATADLASVSRQRAGIRHQGRKIRAAAVQQVQYKYQLDFGELALVGPGALASRAFASGPKAPESASLLTTARTCAGVDALLSLTASCSATSWAVMDAISGRLVHGTI